MGTMKKDQRGDAQRATKTTTPPDHFIKASQFKGSKQGYVFKMGPQGLGYYKDQGPAMLLQRPSTGMSLRNGASRLTTAAENVSVRPTTGMSIQSSSSRDRRPGTGRSTKTWKDPPKTGASGEKWVSESAAVAGNRWASDAVQDLAIRLGKHPKAQPMQIKDNNGVAFMAIGEERDHQIATEVLKKVEPPRPSTGTSVMGKDNYSFGAVYEYKLLGKPRLVGGTLLMPEEQWALDYKEQPEILRLEHKHSKSETPPSNMEVVWAGASRARVELQV